MICPECHGNKTVFVHLNRGDAPHSFEDISCMRCGGSGEVDDRQAEWMRAGQAHRERRLAADEGLRECSRRLGISASELSAMERGTKDPAVLVGEG